MAQIREPENVAALRTLADKQDMSDGALGIVQTTDAVVFIAMLASSAVRWKWTAPQTFLYGLEQMIPKAIAAFDGYELIPAELDDLSEREIGVLVEVMTTHVDFGPLNLTAEEREKGYELPKQIGISETKDVVRFLAKLGMFVVKNRKMDFNAILGGLMSLGPAIFDALGGIGVVLDELADLDEAEAQQLRVVVARELDIADDSVELVVEQAWATTLYLGLAVKHLIEAVSKQVPDKAEAAKTFAGDIIRVVGNIVVLIRTINDIVAPPSSEPVDLAPDAPDSELLGAPSGDETPAEDDEAVSDDDENVSNSTSSETETN